jgi:hypothetical protein
MVTTITLIMWVFLSDGSQTYTTEDAPTLIYCLQSQRKYLLNENEEHIAEPGATYAAGCVVHQQRQS